MADQKISELTALTGANVADDDAIAIVDTSATETKKIVFSELKNALDTATGFVRITGDTMTGNLNMGGNVKAIFGAGSDLQIYHNSANNKSYIEESGSGNLVIRGSDIDILAGNGEAAITVAQDGAVTLYNDNGAKLATTSTGIDVKNVASGANAKLNITTGSTGGGTSEILFSDNTTGRGRIYYDHGSSPEELHIETTGTDALVIDNSQNVTIPNGNFGIGTSSPSPDYGSDVALEIKGASSPGLVINDTGQASKYGIHADSNDLKITYGTGSLATFQNDGNFGIGTSLPTSAIDVRGEAVFGSGTDGVKLTYSGGNSTGIIDTGFTSTGLEFRIANSPAMRIDSSGNVGIGTSPKRHLHINGGNETTKIQITNQTTGSSSDGDGFQLGIATDGTANIEQRENADLNFYTNNDLKMTLDSSGNVGIGTTATTMGKTNISLAGVAVTGDTDGATIGAGGILNLLNSNGGVTDSTTMLLGSTGSSAVGQIASGIGFARESSANWGTQLRFYTHSTSTSDLDELNEAMRIDSSGAVIINNSGGDAQLYLGGTSGADRMYLARSGNDSLLWNVDSGAMRFGTNDTEVMRIDSSGNLLVGKTSAGTTTTGVEARASGILAASRDADVALQINRSTNDGDIARFSKDGSIVGSISVTSSATAYNTSSDYRLKENVVALAGATTRLKQLEPKRFNFITDTDTTVDGFIAHEVQPIVPEAVTGEHNEVDAEGNAVYQGIDQSKLVPLLVATIQELEARITALENA